MTLSEYELTLVVNYLIEGINTYFSTHKIIKIVFKYIQVVLASSFRYADFSSCITKNSKFKEDNFLINKQL